VYRRALEDRERCEYDHEDDDDYEENEANLAEETGREDTVIQQDDRGLGQIDGQLVVDLELEEVLVEMKLVAKRQSDILLRREHSRRFDG
jgi:hypothetical protein